MTRMSEMNGFNEQSFETNLNENILNCLHQNRYMRWHKNDVCFKVNSIDWNSFGDHLIVSSDDKTVRIFNTNGEEVSVIPSLKHGCDGVVFTTDGNTAIFGSKSDSLMNGSQVHKIRHLDIHRKQFIHYYCGHEKQVTCISLNPYHNCFLSSSMDNTIRLWDSRLNTTITAGDRISFGFLQSNGRSIANFDPQGVVFAVGLQKDSSIRLYDIRNYTKGPFKVNKYESDSSFGDWHQLKFSPNGQMISIATNGIKMRVIDAFSLGDISVLTGMKNELKQDLELSWSADSQFLFCGSSSSFARPGDYAHLNQFKAIDGSHVREWKTMHESFMRCVKFNPKYYTIATACHDVSFWNPSAHEIQMLSI